jgi:hypothetical protein
MYRKLLSLFSLFVVPAIVLMIAPSAQASPANPEEVVHMRAGQQKVEGVVTEIKSGLYTVKMSTGATFTLAMEATVPYRRDLPKVGDQISLWVNEGIVVMDVRPNGRHGKTPTMGEVIELHKDMR